MLEMLFIEQANNGGTCSNPLSNGLRFPKPFLGGGIGVNGSKSLVMELKNQYPPTHDALFLPYVPNNINFCFQSNRDVLSTPFSGCRMVMFEYNGTCLLGEGVHLNCPRVAFGCGNTCPYRNKKLVAHVAYEANPNLSCRNIWANIRQKSHIYVDFSPLDIVLDYITNDDHIPQVYGKWKIWSCHN